MVSQKLIALLKSLNKYELNRFRKFLLSPYFNENEHIIDLFEIINNHIRTGEIDLTKVSVWQQIHPNKKYNDLKFRRLCSDLTKLGEDFLGFKQYQELPVRHYNNILASLNRLGLKKHFKSIERQLDNMLDLKSKIRNARYHLEKYVFEYERHMYLEKTSVRRTYKVNLSEADFHLDCFYISQKLQNYCDAINYKNVLNIDININLIDELVSEIEDTPYFEQPTISIYYQIMKTLLEQDNEEHFKKLKYLLEQNGDMFLIKELRTMYIFAQNYCIKKINTGKLDYFRELFDIYKTLLDRGVIFGTKGVLSLSNYKNIITVALAIKEYQWAEWFIYEYNHSLPKEHRKSALTYNLAHLHFNKQNYPRVIELLREMEYRDGFDAISSRWLLLKTYHELDEYDALDALTDSFNIYIRRNKVLSQTNKQKYLNAVKFVNKINRLVFTRNKKEIDQLEEQLMEAKAIVDKKWLLQKLDEVR